MTEPVMHFRNILGIAGSAICDARASERELTLVPTNVTCAACLGRLGRVQRENIAPPPPTQPKCGK